MKWKFTQVTLTIAIGAATVTSAVNADLASPAFIIGAVCAGNATGTGRSLVDSITLNRSTGAITMTTRANVATADLVVVVTVARAVNG